MKKTVITVAVIAALLIGGISVYAVREEGFRGFNNSCGLSEEQIQTLNSKIKADVDEMLANGEITQEQYEQVIKAVEKGRIPSIGGGTPEGKKPDKENPPEISEEKKAEMLQLHKDKLKEQLDAGRITEEEYNELIKKIESGEFNFGRRGPGGGQGKNNPEGRERPGFKNKPFGEKNNKAGNETVTE